MAKVAIACAECGYRSSQWVGRCPKCSAWNSFVEAGASASLEPAVVLQDLASRPEKRTATGMAEFDRVLGGGFVAGSVVLVAGEPGVGKSTLMLQVARCLSVRHRVLVTCGEESLEQVAARASRIGGTGTSAAMSCTDAESIAAAMGGYDVVIVDSVQTLTLSEAPGEPGSVSQVRASAAALAAAARRTGTAVVLIGHVTKDGAVAGPRALEHLVDVVIMFEGDRGHSLRSVRGVKNRFGPAAEVGVFEMGSRGLTEVPDASALFLRDRNLKVPGSAVGAAIQGQRPIALEVQTLVVGTDSSLAKRVSQGFETSRLGLMLGIIQKRLQKPFNSQDVYASIAGGYKLSDPGMDLALAMALIASLDNHLIPPDVIFIGEVGLGGEIRVAPGMRARLKESGRLGFRRAVVPCSIDDAAGPELVRCEDIRAADAYVKRSA